MEELEVTCSMVCRIDLYVMNVCCKCRVEMHGYDKFIDLSTLKYSDIHVCCLVESFTHPVEWSTEGDYRHKDYDHAYANEWSDIKSTLITRIHEGYYNYELAYKSLNLVRSEK